jgi:hypothetical protein
MNHTPQTNVSLQASRSATRRPNLVTKAVFLEALGRIQRTGAAGVGSRSLGVYHINGEVSGRQAVVKIIDGRVDNESEIRNEAARLNHVGHLLAWGRRKASPRLYYLLMENMGVRVDKVEGLDPKDPDDEKFIDAKKTTALKQQEGDHKLKHE